MADTADSKSAPGNRVGVQVPPGASDFAGAVLRSRVSAWLALGAAVYAAGPSVATALLQRPHGYELLRTVADHAVTFALALTLLLMASRAGRLREWAMGMVGFLGAVYGALLWGLIGYWLWSGHQFDARFALDVGGDVVRTLLATLGWQLVAMVVGLFLFGATLWGYWRLGALWLRSRSVEVFRSWAIALPLSLLGVIWGLCAHEQRLVWPELAVGLARVWNEPVVAPIFPDTASWPVQGEESVYVLQLESGSAHALSGSVELHGRRYDGDYAPNLRRLAKEGVFFPFFWSNSVQSNRALENILCAITNNVGQALSYNPAKIVSECLPAVLRRAGYRTLFYVAFDDPDFMNYRNFIRFIGFEEFRDARSLGMPVDVTSWGIDDCRFYDAVFQDLTQRPVNEKRFVYIAVSAHHYPFAGRAEYAHLHPFVLPQAPIEWYLNSWVEQDHCLETFSAGFQRLTHGQAHLIVTPDHSWPVGMHGNHLNDYGWFDENFAVPFVYVPPRQRAAEFRTGEILDVRPSLADLPPTVLELLDGKPRAGSFAGILYKGGDADVQKNSEWCHLLVQPYGGGAIVIQRATEKYVYHLKRKRLERYDRLVDPEERAPELVAEPMEYSEVRQRYYCERYRLSRPPQG